MPIWTLFNLFADPHDPSFPQEAPDIPALPAADARRGARLRWIALSILNICQSRLSARPLAPGVREQISGWLGNRGECMAAPLLILAVRRRPELFPDLIDAIDELADDNDEAVGWQSMLVTAQRLLTICQDGVAWGYARVSRRTGAILDQILAGAEHPGLAPHLDHEARLVVVSDALTLRAEGRAKAVAAREESQALRARLEQLTPEEREALKAELRQRRQMQTQQRNRRAQGAAVRRQLIAELLGE